MSSNRLKRTSSFRGRVSIKTGLIEESFEKNGVQKESREKNRSLRKKGEIRCEERGGRAAQRRLENRDGAVWTREKKRKTITHRVKTEKEKEGSERGGWGREESRPHTKEKRDAIY